MPRPPKKRPKQSNGAVPSSTTRPIVNGAPPSPCPMGHRPYVSAGTEVEAHAKRDELLVTVAAGEPVERGTGPTVATQLEWWRDYAMPARKLAPATVEQYRWALALLTKGLGRARLRSLTPEHVERFLGQAGRGRLQRQQCANRPAHVAYRS